MPAHSPLITALRWALVTRGPLSRVVACAVTPSSWGAGGQRLLGAGLRGCCCGGGQLGGGQTAVKQQAVKQGVVAGGAIKGDQVEGGELVLFIGRVELVVQYPSRHAELAPQLAEVVTPLEDVAGGRKVVV